MVQSEPLNKLISTMEGWFSKLPSLPKEWKDVIVKVAPWFALIFGVLGVLGGISALGLLTVFSPLAALGGGAQAVGAGLLVGVLLLLSSGLMVAAFPGTRAMKASGWNLLFLSELVGVVSAVLSFSPFGILFSAVGFYILFQIRSYYK